MKQGRTTWRKGETEKEGRKGGRKEGREVGRKEGNEVLHERMAI